MPDIRPIGSEPAGQPIGTCGQCHTAHDPRRCQGHVDPAKRDAYSQGGREARAATRGQLRQCRQYPRRGLAVCDAHGAAAKQSRAAAERNRGEQLARRAMATYGLPIEISPADALLQEVHRTAGHVAWLGERIQSLTPDDLVWSTAREVDKRATETPGIDTTQAAVEHAWVRLYREERAHLAAVSKAALAAGIEERRVRLAESQGALLAGVIRAVLGDLDLTPVQLERAAEAVPRHLRSVA